MYLKLFLASLVLSSTISCVSLPSRSETCSTGVLDENSECKPFRAGVLVLDKGTDQVKPLVSVPFSGFVSDQGVILSEFKTGWIGALSPKTGGYKYWIDLKSAVASPITIFGGFGYVSLRNGEILKFDTLDGKIVWRLDVGRFSDREMRIFGQALFMQSVDNQLFAVDAVSGQKVWVYDAGKPEELSMRAGAVPVVTENLVFMGTSKGEVHILEAATGKKLRAMTLPIGGFRFKDVVGQVVVDSGDVTFAKYDGGVGRISYDTTSPVVKWKKELASISATEFREGILYVGCSNGDLYAFDARNGNERWKISTGQTVLSINNLGKVLFIVGSNGLISAVNASSGQLEWIDDVEASLAERPVVQGDEILFGTGYNTLYSYKIR